MSDKPEPLAAILAEMREYADHRAADAGGERPAIELLRSYADRIEAAVERERDAHTNDIHNALYMATGIPGNAAALREALKNLVHRKCLVEGSCGKPMDELCTHTGCIWHPYRSALSASPEPPSDAAKMRDAILAIKEINDRRPHDADGYEINDIIEEALAPAKGGAK